MKSDQTQDMEKKIALGVEVALTLFGMWDTTDIEKFAALLKQRRILKAKALFSGAQAKTGKSYQQAIEGLNENTNQLKELVNKEEAWL